MVDLRVTDPLISDLRTLQKTLQPSKKAESPGQQEVNSADEVVRVDVDPMIEKLAKTSPALDQPHVKPAITEQEARGMALDIGQNIKGSDVPFAGGSERIILGLFS